jgi:O-antigen/teichoic acid export membrane protein
MLKAALGFLTGMLVARGLGPDQYGKMMFLLATFTALRQLLDIGSSTAFFTFLSQRPRSKQFVGWFSAWLAVQFLIPLLAVGLLFPAAWMELIWKGEQRSLVVLAFVAAYMQSTVWTVVMQMGESQRQTRLAQGVGAAVTLFHLLLVAVSWWQDWLGVRLILAAIAIEWAVAAWLVAKQLRFPTYSDEKESIGDLIKEFGRYCLPLIPYSWLGFVYDFADRWLLQVYGGSVQQAYYAVALQFGAIVAIASSSILNVFWKEIAEAHQKGNHERIAILYRRVSRGLFLVSASMAGYLLPWSGDILRLTLGPAYVGGAIVLAIMLVYPIHQSMGQLGAAMLYATGRVRAQVVLGVVTMASSILATYFVLAPPDAPISGFGLGSVGLASKMVVLQLLAVNAVAFYLAKSMRITFDWTYQLVCCFGCFGSGWLAYFISHDFYFAVEKVWVGMLMSAIIHSLIVFTIVWIVPSLTGLTRGELVTTIRGLVGTKLNHGGR